MITLDTLWLTDEPVDCTYAQIQQRIRDYRSAPPAYNAEELDEYISQGLAVARRAKGRASAGFSQSLHETAGLRFGNQVKPEQFNFGGLGATNDGAQGGSFPTLWHGWMAFWAHHMNYWWGEFQHWPSWAADFIEHAYRNDDVLRAGYGGVVDKIGDYTNGRWAWTKAIPIGSLANGYAYWIRDGANAIRALPAGEEPSMSAQIPGFIWHPAAETHYTKGRGGKKIQGGAQHYSAGTNSLGWLTKDSGRNDPNARVSATCLIKHNPTMNDRGHQLVRIEDTSWTTGEIVNPIVVAFEYEHVQGQPIPDIAYEVMAQSWLDADAYAKANNLGSIGFNVKGHREWTGNNSTICPDGIDVPRIVATMKRLAGGSPPPVGDHLNPNPATPDPWNSPFGKFYVPNDILAAMRRAVDDGGFHSIGFIMEGAKPEDGNLVQYTERARFERHPNRSIHRGRLGVEILELQYRIRELEK